MVLLFEETVSCCMPQYNTKLAQLGLPIRKIACMTLWQSAKYIPIKLIGG